MRLAAAMAVLLLWPPVGHVRNSPATGRRARLSSAGFVLAKEYVWPYVGGDRIPLCTDDPDCEVVCGVGVVTGAASAWECKGHDGLAYGTVTDPAGTYVDSFIPSVRAKDLNHAVADAPSLRSTALDAIFNSGSAWTVVAGGMPRTNADTYYWWVNRTGGTSGQFNLYGQSGETYCARTTASVTMASTAIVNGYGMFACRFDGTSLYSGDHQVSTDTNTDATAQANIVGTGSWYFGNRSAQDLGINGPLAFVAFYKTGKSAAWTRGVLSKYQGSYNAAGQVSYLSSQLIGVDHTATTGNVDLLYSASALIDPRGLFAQVAYTNVYGTDTLAAATWTDVGTPTVNSNASSGPWAVETRAAECDEIVDDDAAAFEGKQATGNGLGVGWRNNSCYLKAGLTGTVKTKARLAFTTDATSSVSSCDFSGLTSTAQRLECITQITGSPTSIRAQVLVGNDVADTGSVQVCGCQHTAGRDARMPVPSNSVRSTVHYTMDPVADEWPTFSLGGKIEIVHTPTFDPLNDWISGTLSTDYVADFSQNVTPEHVVAFIWGYTVAGRMLAVVRNSPSTSDITIDGIAMTAWQPYVSSTEWVPVGNGKCDLIIRHNICATISTCHATTVIGSDLTHAATCPGQPTTGTLGNRYSGGVATSVLVSAVRVYAYGAQ